MPNAPISELALAPLDALKSELVNKADASSSFPQAGASSQTSFAISATGGGGREGGGGGTVSAIGERGVIKADPSQFFAASAFSPSLDDALAETGGNEEKANNSTSSSAPETTRANWSQQQVLMLWIRAIDFILNSWLNFYCYTKYFRSLCWTCSCPVMVPIGQGKTIGAQISRLMNGTVSKPTAMGW